MLNGRGAIGDGRLQVSLFQESGGACRKGMVVGAVQLDGLRTIGDRLGGVPLLQIDLGTPDIRGAVIGLAANGLCAIDDRLVQLSLVVVHLGPVAIGDGQLRILANSVIEVFHGLSSMTGTVVGQPAKSVMLRGLVAGMRDCLVKVAQRFLGLPQLQEGLAALTEDIRLFETQPNGLRQVDHTLRVIPCRAVRHAAHGVGRRELGRELQRGVAIEQRVLHFAHLQVHRRPQQQGLRVLAVELQRSMATGERLRVILLPHIAGGPVQPGLQQSIVQLQGLGIVLDGLVIRSLVSMHPCPQQISFGHAGMLLNGLLTLCPGFGALSQLELRQRVLAQGMAIARIQGQHVGKALERRLIISIRGSGFAKHVPGFQLLAVQIQCGAAIGRRQVHLAQDQIGASPLQQHGGVSRLKLNEPRVIGYGRIV